MRACSGTWIAHGSGNADREVVDAQRPRARCRPASDDYQLRRIWLTPEEEQGYYYGFANEGLWPLCHVAHVRPVFRESDWEALQARSTSASPTPWWPRRAARTRSCWCRTTTSRCCRAMVREQLPQRHHPHLLAHPLAQPRVVRHLPVAARDPARACWAAPSSASTRASTARTSSRRSTATSRRASSTSTRRSRSASDETLVESYPISIEWPSPRRCAQLAARCRVPRRSVRERLGLPPDTELAVGVDRFDYTKGILERLQRGRAPAGEASRVDRPLRLRAGGRADAQRAGGVPRRSRSASSALARAHQRALRPAPATSRCTCWRSTTTATPSTSCYRAADVCIVTSLHDGMNLVCKEFVAARDDEQGVLILSRFAGAAREMPEALIVNPYHVEETADALHRAADDAGGRAARAHGQPAQRRCASSTSSAGPAACSPTPAAGA